MSCESKGMGRSMCMTIGVCVCMSIGVYVCVCQLEYVCVYANWICVCLVKGKKKERKGNWISLNLLEFICMFNSEYLD